MNCFSFLSDCTWIPPRFDVSASYQVLWQGPNFGWYQWPAIKKNPATMRDLEYKDPVSLVVFSYVSLGRARGVLD